MSDITTVLRLLGASAFALVTVGLSPAEAQVQSAPVAASVVPGYVLPETETWELKSEDDYPYQIFVSMPKGTPPPGGYPMLYILDANALFAGFAETRRVLAFTNSDIGKSIVVGIGYKTDRPYDARRIYDFVPALKKPVPPTQAYYEKYKSGGQELFARFILDRLKPELARRYAINPARQALFGHSFGGLFALYMLYNHPTALHAIIAASPSIWWNDQAILTDERNFATKLVQDKIQGPVSRVRIVTGDLDEMPAESADGVAMAARLKPLSAYGLRSESELFKGETHINVPSRSVTSTLRFAFTWP